MIRVAIVSDSALYREGLALVLAQNDHLEVVAVYCSLDVATNDVSNVRPEALLVDMSHAGARDRLRDTVIAAGETKIIAVGVGNAVSEVIACAEAGAASFVLREESVDSLVETVEEAANDRLRCSRRLAGAMFRRIGVLSATREAERSLVDLTPRESETLGLINEGLSNKEIAAQLTISVATVKNHVHNILEKLGAQSRGEAAARMRKPMPRREFERH